MSLMFTIKNMKYSCLLALLFLVEYGSSIVRPRCAGQFNLERDPVVSTQNGNVLGLKETKIDQRQNKSVTWTSYFVISTHGLASHSIMIVVGYSIRATSYRRTEVSSSSSPDWPVGLCQGRSEIRGTNLSSGQRQIQPRDWPRDPGREE